MAKVNYPALADDILVKVGGAENVDSATHCITRLRLFLKDNSKVDKQAVEQLEGVITTVSTGGQFQVVIGDNVTTVYDAFVKHLPDKAAAGDVEEQGTGQKQSLLNQFIQLISAIFLPVVWTLAGAGLFKAFVALAVTLGILNAESQTFVILDAAADSVLYFLPVLLAITTAKRFGVNQFVLVAIAGALLYPTIIALNETGEPVHFMGIPVVMTSYVSSVIPIIVAGWLLSYLERGMDKVLPTAIRNFTKPLISLFVMVPLVLILIGPISTYTAQGLAGGITYLFNLAPWLGGALMGGLWQVLVIFGLHWGLVPIAINDLTTVGYSLLFGPVIAAVLAQGAATLAVFLRSRSAKRRQVAGPAALSGIMAGVTEPAIYGVNLPLKRPLYFGVVGGAVGGAIIGLGGGAANTFVVPSALALPAYIYVGSFALTLIGCGVAMAIAFVLTFLFMDRETPDDVAATATEAAVPAPPDQVAPAPQDPSAPTGVNPAVATAAAGTATATRHRVVDVVAPVSGQMVVLEEVPDKVFASKALGEGVGIVPDEGTVRSPITGKVISVASSGHAFGLKSDDGVELLVHIGIDTVELKGQHFTVKVAKGETVNAGEILAEVDFAAVQAAGYDTTTIVTVTNTAKLQEVTPAVAGPVEAGAPAVVVIP
ncbi:beta-glucoside-specific PTS transporter subunit IIABC [Kocuria sp.]|uniref:beta-glucoside-specific PTS transporter subunit IIABC n=1 Tax=Kocuria sp. TaxID=1871328 RepID=UPI0026DFC25F|nr:beta-glucoside-specific PTS transporter subunit IIABC [Kocuria sp.]MDO5618100.1 beta-glucoside-specific PTS transporter subunit IIABC [Kocuria sp.]